MTRLRGLAAAAAVATVAGVAAGCGPPRYELSIYNLDRAPVFVRVNGATMGRLDCADLPIVMVPNLSTPKLPWRVEIVDESGTTLDPVVLDGQGPTDQALLIRDDGLVTVPPADPVSAARPPTRAGCPGIDPARLPQGTRPPG